ncbi:MAG: adenylyltransferase/cytidyltransferase family protein [Candidatus Nanoarchaeia archaeon]|nr:adenylyltransferase/cytidyltransferase family protein [Candidatus Nanoarchaeia archaeon]MDD5740486.1 adenylyltransferase/cytidyltransferase family protein [Candidatus Nanoarchaeia archaeon]
MKKSVLIIGRFQPFHTGHLELIKKYCRLGYFIKIGIGSVNKPCDLKNPLTFKERANIIRGVLKDNKIKDYELYSIPDIPRDSLYAGHVSKIVGKYDLVITGNMLIKNIFLKYCSSSATCRVDYFNEKVNRIKEIKAKNIRKRWLFSKPNKKEISKSTFGYLKKAKFSDRLKEIYNFKRIKVREI